MVRMAISRIEPAANEVLAGLEAKTKHPNPFYRVMAHRPEVLKTFAPFYAAVVGPGSLDRRLKELAYMATSFANRCAYCTAAHTVSARKAGLTDEQLHAIEAETDSGFTAPEQALLRYARELTRTATVTPATRAAVAGLFTEEQVVELNMVIGVANFTNRFNNGLEILPEEH
jgi:uncharacterized peroxidase-related enzyme